MIKYLDLAGAKKIVTKLLSKIESSVPKKVSDLTNDANYITSNEAEQIINTKGFKTEDEIKLIEVDKAKAAMNATTAGNALSLGGNLAKDYVLNIDLESKDYISHAKDVALSVNTTLIKGWYKISEDSVGRPEGVKNGFLNVLEQDHDTRQVLQVLYDTDTGVIYSRYISASTINDWRVIPVINDKDRSGIRTTYSAQNIENILSSPQYTTLKVRVEKQGESNYTADYNDNDIRNYFNAGGDVVLRYENQEFSFDKYLAGTGAIFNYNEITASSATRIKIVVKYDKSVEVTREALEMPKVKEPRAIRAKVGTNWTAIGGFYHYALNVPGLTAEDNVIVSIATDNTTAAYDMASGMGIKPISQSVDTIQLTAASAPTTEFYLALLIL